MKFLLVKPNIGRMEHSLYVDEGRMEPLQLGVIAGLTPTDIEITLADDRMEEIPYDENFDLVIITVETFTARRAYEIADEFRARKIPVLLGGFHPTLLPEEAKQHADSIFLHDAECAWHQVIEDMREFGKPRPEYHSKCGVGQAGGYKPRRDLFKGKGYLPITLMQFGRGCNFSCQFCAISAFFNKGHYTRPIDEVLDEINEQARKLIFFVDDNIVANKTEAKELFKAMIPLKKRWVSQGCLDMLDDPELMKLMVKSGCLGNVLGFESINPQDLKDMKKASNLTQEFDGYERQIQLLRDYGLQTWAAFTLGHDWETPEDIEKTYQFAMKHKFTFAAFNILVPYPNTPLYKKMEEEGRLLYDGKWWLHPEYRFNHAAFKPKRMTPDELTESVFEVRRKFNSLPSIFKRFLDPKTNMSSFERAAIYWGYNPLFRKETFKKNGMKFGLK